MSRARILADYVSSGDELADKAPLASPTFTGTPITTTASAATNTTQIASTAYVRTEVTNLVDSAPAALDTLNELAAALGDDAAFSTTVTNSIAAKLPLGGGTMSGAVTGMTGLTGGTGDFNWDSNTLVVDSSASAVGIGTAAPLNSLQIDSGTGANASNKFYDLLKLKGKNNSNNAVGVLFSVESSAGGAGVDYSKGGLVYDLAGGSWGRGKFHFLQQGSANTSDADISNAVMTIDNSGNVGIGTDAPAHTLEIHNPTIADYTDFGLKGTGHKYVIGIGNEAVATVNDKLYFYDDDNGAFRIVVDTSGNVGIGTTSPPRPLTCYSAEASVSHIKTTHGSAGNINQWTIGGSSPDNESSYFLYCDDSTAVRYIIYSSGDTWSADGGAVNSDERLKENIIDATTKLDDINKLKVRNFNWRTNDSENSKPIHNEKSASKKRIGFIAQEIEEVFPGLVDEHEFFPKIEAVEAVEASEGVEAVEAVEAEDAIFRKGIKTTALIPILVKGIQELSAKVTALENA
jgi:hypothetical protein